VDPSDAGKHMAIVSSGGFVPVDCKLAVTLRLLARASFQDAQDLFGLGKATLYAFVWECVYALDNILEEPFKHHNKTVLSEMATSMFERSKRTMRGCIGASDGMVVRTKSTTRLDDDNANPASTSRPRMYGCYYALINE
jgi:hypothetical protein